MLSGFPTAKNGRRSVYRLALFLPKVLLRFTVVGEKINSLQSVLDTPIVVLNSSPLAILKLA